MSNKIERLGENAYVSNISGGVLFQFSKEYDTKSFQTGQNILVPYQGGGKFKIMSWGLNNDMPNARELLIEKNPLIGTLMETKRDILCGTGLMPYQVELKKNADGSTTRLMHEVDMPKGNGKAPSPQDVLDNSGGEMEVFMRGFGEAMTHGQEFVEFVTTKGGHISSLETQKCRQIRAEIKGKDGVIRNWYWSGRWQQNYGDGYMNPFDGTDYGIYKIPAYVRGMDLAKLPTKFIMRLSASLLDDMYYFTPSWQGSRDWAELMNIIPIFHQHNLKNGYTLRWHIKIPKDYFLDGNLDAMTKDDQAAAIKKEDALRKAFISKMNKYLAGLENTGRAIYTEFEINRAVGKEFPGIQIEPLDVKLNDDALLKLLDKTLSMTGAAQAIHPTLANIDNGMGRSAGGSEILRAWQMYLLTKAYVPREVSLEKWRLAHKVNGWDASVKWTFRDQTLTTLSDNKNGMQQGGTN